jgi:hypothetical protein
MNDADLIRHHDFVREQEQRGQALSGRLLQLVAGAVILAGALLTFHRALSFVSSLLGSHLAAVL